MIRIIVDMPYENGKRFIKAAGLSTDNKPTDGIITGSRFLEVDYGVERIFDEENGVWDFFQGAVDIQSFTATANATYNAPYGKAYNPVIVDVPNTYTAEDEGKVVSNGALVAQTAHAEVTENGTIDTTLNNSVTVNVSGVAANDVNFYGYDGTIVASYSAADFANLTALPANPDRTREGLTAQGWNWTLSDAKTYVAAYGRLNIGQMYITTDGKTHVHIRLEQGRTSPMLGVCPNGTVDVDWGDGTAHDTLTGTSTTTVQWTPTHNYTAPGDYVIKLSVTGTMYFSGPTQSTNSGSYLLRYRSSDDYRNSIYQNAVRKVYIGSGDIYINDYGFAECNALNFVTIPYGSKIVGSCAFLNCKCLKSITIPDGVIYIGASAFNGCTSLSSIAMPKSISSVIGESVFNICLFSSINIPLIQNIQNSFLYGCTNLTNITIPEGVNTIGTYALYNCRNISILTIPSSVYGINANAFRQCGGLTELHFKSSSPPNVNNANAFSDIPTDCKIYVPTGSLSAYTSASNYPSSSTYTYIEE